MSKDVYQSQVNQVKRQLKAAQMAGLREMGKLAAKEVRKAAPVKTRKLKRSIQYWARSKETNLQIGIKPLGWYALFLELGHKLHPFFVSTIEKMIPQLREIEAKTIKERMGKIENLDKFG